MEENKIDSLVVVEQLPVIKEQLKLISDEVDKEINYALSLECDEDSKKEVKDARARLNKIKTILEDKRKKVKNAVMTPYDEFEKIYNELVKSKLVKADDILKNKINEIEILQKDEKELELKEFANNYFNSYNIQNLVRFENIGLNITLSASIKSLKDQIIEFCKKIENDLNLIELEEYKNEILVEYKNNLDFSKSKIVVYQRHKDLEEVNRKNEELNKQREEEKKVVEKVEEIIKEQEIALPKEIIEEDVKSLFQFKVLMTDKQAKELINWFKERGIKYE